MRVYFLAFSEVEYEVCPTIIEYFEEVDAESMTEEAIDC